MADFKLRGGPAGLMGHAGKAAIWPRRRSPHSGAAERAEAFLPYPAEHMSTSSRRYALTPSATASTVLCHADVRAARPAHARC